MNTTLDGLEDVTKTTSFVISIRQIMWIKSQTAIAKQEDPGANDSKTLRAILDRAMAESRKGDAA